MLTLFTSSSNTNQVFIGGVDDLTILPNTVIDFVQDVVTLALSSSITGYSLGTAAITVGISTMALTVGTNPVSGTVYTLSSASFPNPSITPT